MTSRLREDSAAPKPEFASSIKTPAQVRSPACADDGDLHLLPMVQRSWNAATLRCSRAASAFVLLRSGHHKPRSGFVPAPLGRNTPLVGLNNSGEFAPPLATLKSSCAPSLVVISTRLPQVPAFNGTTRFTADSGCVINLISTMSANAIPTKRRSPSGPG